LAVTSASVKPELSAIEAVGHHGPELDTGLASRLDQLDSQLRLGPEPRIPLATG
jgi:hypothetical protein